MVWVALPGPPLVRIHTMSKSWSEPIIDRNAQIRMVGPSSGMVMRRWVCHQVAPSSAAASLRSGETPWSPARNRMIAKPMYFQVSTTKTV